MAGIRTSASRDARNPRVLGRYALFDEIASGGMATVHLGRLVGPVGFSRTVAIKRLHPQFAKDPEFVSMFLDEARLASRIQHPNVVSTLDIVTLDDEVFLVMEYVPGESLARLLKNAEAARQQIPVGHVASIMSGILHGLHAAHEAKSERREALDIVHRDVSPHNVLVGSDGVGRVLDFGVAKAALRSQSTRDGQMKGRISYMSPEQLNGRQTDRRTDIFAAGIILWEALTGARLFEGADAGEIVAKVLANDIPEPQRVRLDLPKRLNDVVMRALERDVDLRYQTARDFAIDLEEAIPLATAREVGDWVDDLGGEPLARRAELVREIEQVVTEHEEDSVPVPTVPPPPEPEPEPELEPEEPEPSFSGPRPRRDRDSTPAGGDRLMLSEHGTAMSHVSTPVPPSKTFEGSKLVILAVVACVAGGALAFAVFGGESPSRRSSPEGAGSEEPGAPGAASPGEPSNRAKLPTLSIGDLPAVPDAGRSSSARNTAKAHSKAAATATSAVKCNPPWVVDANGIRRAKPECL
jgi:serine/threonine protein kinase